MRINEELMEIWPNEVCNTKEQEAFEELKEKITTQPVLALPKREVS